jgi:hypothetical protein
VVVAPTWVADELVLVAAPRAVVVVVIGVLTVPVIVLPPVGAVGCVLVAVVELGVLVAPVADTAEADAGCAGVTTVLRVGVGACVVAVTFVETAAEDEVLGVTVAALV